MKTSDFDKRFDSGENISDALDRKKSRRPGLEQKRVTIDFPRWMIERLDREADRAGVTRQSIVKLWISERLDRGA